MEEITQKQNEISIMEIVRLLLSKIKLIILVVLAGALLGAGIGFIRTHNVEYYGTELKFYINPSKDMGSSVNSDSQYGVYGAYGKNVLNNMVELLESEAFAEKLLLDENGLPATERMEKLTPHYTNKYANDAEKLEKALQDIDTLTTLVATAKVEVDKYNAKYAEMNTALTELNVANEVLAEHTATLNVLWAEALSKYPALPSKPEENNSLITDTELQTKINVAIKAVHDANATALKLQQKHDSLYKEVKVLATSADKAKEPALELWRVLDPTYTTDLNNIVYSSSFSYYDETADVEADDLARSFIYVNISVLNNQKYAEDLRLLLIEAVPEYIVDKMPIPSGYDGTNCIRISRTDEVHLTNSGVVTKTAAKYGLLLALASFVVVCVIIIIVDRSDKRLRSLEQITDVFNVPVLGVIPTFKNSEHAEAEEKKAKTSTEVKK